MSVVAILGMHRSGTSCLTGMLEDAGLELGCVSRSNPHNLKGNNEQQTIVALHEDILAENHGSWDNPPASGCRWSQQQRSTLKNVVKEHAHLKTWGFKDPRTLFTLEGWLDEVSEMQFVGSFRHPLCVAQSLHARGRGDLSQHLELWWLYNRRLLQFHNRLGFDLINFDASPEVYLECVIRAAANLGFVARAEELTFFDPQLRSRSKVKDIVIPAHVIELHQELLARSLQ